MSTNQPPPSELHAQITNACQRLFQFPPHEWQSDVIRSLIMAHQRTSVTNMLVIRTTGGGKSLIYQVASTMIKGITLFISPLLALASDQTHNLERRTDALPDVTCIHLDGMAEQHIKIIAHDITELRHPVTKLLKGSIILFASPQFLTGRKGKSIMTSLLDETTSALHMTLMDEVHIASQFGNTFRSEFGLLKSRLYKKLPSCCKINLFMTGTCNEMIKTHFTELLGIKITHTEWPEHQTMRHRFVSIEFQYTNMILKEVKKKCMPLLLSRSSDVEKKMIVYSNMREKIIKMTKQLELFLNTDERLYLADAISIHGQLTHQEKAAYLKMFMGNAIPFEFADIRILLATSGVANAGIDCSTIYTAIRIEFPPSIMDMCQEKGRVGRVPSPSPDVYSYMVCFDINSLVLLLKRTLDPTETMTAEYRRSMVADHLAVAKLFCSVDACFNETFETALANPDVRINPDEVGESNRCGICPGCRRELASLYQRIALDGAKEILFSVVNCKPQFTVKEFVDYIWVIPRFSAVLFRRNRQKQNVRKWEIQLFMFQLIAWEMLIPIFDKDQKAILFKAAVSSNDSAMYSFQIETNWDNIPQLPKLSSSHG